MTARAAASVLGVSSLALCVGSYYGIIDAPDCCPLPELLLRHKQQEGIGEKQQMCAVNTNAKLIPKDREISNCAENPTFWRTTQLQCMNLMALLIVAGQSCLDARLSIPDASNISPTFMATLHGDGMLALLYTKTVERLFIVDTDVVKNYCWDILKKIVISKSISDEFLQDDKTIKQTAVWEYRKALESQNPFQNNFSEIALIWEDILTGDIDCGSDFISKSAIVQAATFPALVLWVTSHQSAATDTAVSALLFSLDSLSNSHTLLVLLTQRFDQKSGMKVDKYISQTRTNVLHVIHMWVNERWTDFSNDAALLDGLSYFLGEACQGAAWHATAARATLLSIRRKLHEAKQETRWFSRLASSIGRNKVNSVSFAEATTQQTREAVVCALTHNKFDPKHIARQFALLEFDIFSNIQSEEFKCLAWSKEQRDTLAPNIVKLTNSFNSISQFVYMRILIEVDVKERAKQLKFWIMVSRESFLIRDFHTTLAVVSALNSAGVSRLKRTWKLLPTKYLNEYNDLSLLMNSEGNFRKYRAAIALPTPQPNSNQSQTISAQTLASPCLPYLGVFLSDLTFIEEGNPTTVVLPDNEIIERVNTQRCCRNDTCVLYQIIHQNWKKSEEECEVSTTEEDNVCDSESGEFNKNVDKCTSVQPKVRYTIDDHPDDFTHTLINTPGAYFLTQTQSCTKKAEPTSTLESFNSNSRIREPTKELFNFSRCRLTYNVVHTIKRYQACAYTFTLDGHLQSLLWAAKTYGMDEKEAYRISLELEPREQRQLKDRLSTNSSVYAHTEGSLIATPPLTPLLGTTAQNTSTCTLSPTPTSVSSLSDESLLSSLSMNSDTLRNGEECSIASNITISIPSTNVLLNSGDSTNIPKSRVSIECPSSPTLSVNSIVTNTQIKDGLDGFANTIKRAGGATFDTLSKGGATIGSFTRRININHKTHKRSKSKNSSSSRMRRSGESLEDMFHNTQTAQGRT
eukprot:CFRG7334T1